MNRALERALAGVGAGSEPIRVDVDALWRKALDDGKNVSIRVKHDSSETRDDKGELASISAWAKHKGKKR